IEKLDGETEILLLDCSLHPAHQKIAGVAARGDPQRPDPLLDGASAVIVGRDLERLEQGIEVVGAVAAGSRCLARRGPPIRLGRKLGRKIRAFWRGFGGESRPVQSDGKCQSESESQSHKWSLITPRGPARLKYPHRRVIKRQRRRQACASFGP